MLPKRGRSGRAVGPVVAVLPWSSSLFVVERRRPGRRRARSTLPIRRSALSRLVPRRSPSRSPPTRTRSRSPPRPTTRTRSSCKRTSCSLAKTQRQLKTTRKHLRAVKARAQNAAVEAYVTGDGFDSQFGGILDSSVNDAQSAVGLLRRRRAHPQVRHEPAARGQRPPGRRTWRREARTTAAAAAAQRSADKARARPRRRRSASSPP